METTFEEAELKKQTISRSDSDFGTVQKAHHSTYDRAFREFDQVIKEYERINNVTFDTVYLAGGGALFPGIDKLLKEKVERDVDTANPFKKVAYPAFMQDTMLEIGPSFTAALGAAIRVFE